MNVYLRRAADGPSCLLTECDFTEIDELCGEILKRGVYATEGVYRETEAQFVLTETSAYVEIILMGEPE